jgi:hypothetical protein
MEEKMEMNSVTLCQHSMRLEENGMSMHNLRSHVPPNSDKFVPDHFLSHLKTNVNRLNGDVSAVSTLEAKFEILQTQVLDLRRQLEMARDEISTHEDVIARLMEQDETEGSSDA